MGWGAGEDGDGYLTDGNSVRARYQYEKQNMSRISYEVEDFSKYPNLWNDLTSHWVRTQGCIQIRG